MTERAGPEPVVEWLQEQLRLGRSHLEIAEDLGMSRSAVSRNIGKMKRGEEFGSKFRPAAERRIAFERRERDLLAQQAREREAREQREQAERELREKVRRARRRQEEREAEERARGERELEERREKTRQQLAEARTRLHRKGIIGGERLYGDADYLLRVGVGVHHHDEGAEEIAFAPDRYRFPCGWTAQQLREGVTAEQRMQPSAVPAGSAMPDFIGDRPATLVSFVKWRDEQWFYGPDYHLVQTWRELNTRPLLDERDPPFMPLPEEAHWYEQLLKVEQKLSARGYVVPGPDNPRLFEALPLAADQTSAARSDFEARLRKKETISRTLRRMAHTRYYAEGLWLLATPTPDDTVWSAAKRVLVTMLALGVVGGTAYGLLIGLALVLSSFWEVTWNVAQGIRALFA